MLNHIDHGSIVHHGHHVVPPNSSAPVCPGPYYTILRSVTIVLEGTLAIQLASVWTWRLWRKNPFDQRHPIPVRLTSNENLVMKSNSFLSDLKDMVRKKNTPSILLILVWIVELGTSFCFAVCMFQLPVVQDLDPVLQFILGEPQSLSFFWSQKVIVGLCCIIECILMAGAVWTHIKEKHTLSDCICAISVLMQCLLILLCEWSTVQRESELLVLAEKMQINNKGNSNRDQSHAFTNNSGYQNHQNLNHLDLTRQDIMMQSDEIQPSNFQGFFSPQNEAECAQYELSLKQQYGTENFNHDNNVLVTRISVFLGSELLKRQNLIASALFISCTLMVMWAVFTGIYLELLRELGCCGQEAQTNQRSISYTRLCAQENLIPAADSTNSFTQNKSTREISKSQLGPEESISESADGYIELASDKIKAT